MCLQCASGSQGGSHVHSTQEALSIMNYCKVFVFTVCKRVTEGISCAQYATAAEYYELL
jgi:hypothetical protein